MKRTIAALGVAVLTTVGISQATSAADYGYDGIDMDCTYAHFDSVEEARAYWFADGGSIDRNVDDMDRDRDGMACDAGLSGTPPDDPAEQPDEDPGDDNGGDGDDSGGDDSDGDDGDDSGDDDSSGDDGDNGGSGSGDPDRVQTPVDSTDESEDEGSGSDNAGDDSGSEGQSSDSASSGDNAGSDPSDSSDSVTTLPSTGAGAGNEPSFVIGSMLLAAITAVLAAVFTTRRSRSA